jgi:hypothetical protein
VGADVLSVVTVGVTVVIAVVGATWKLSTSMSVIRREVAGDIKLLRDDLARLTDSMSRMQIDLARSEERAQSQSDKVGEIWGALEDARKTRGKLFEITSSHDRRIERLSYRVSDMDGKGPAITK